jgi:hypothetical protein
VGLFATIISELCKNKKECTTKQNRAKITLTANVQSLVWQHDSKTRLSCFLQVCSSSSSSASYIKNNQCRIAWKLLYIEDAELQISISQYDASLYFLVRAYSYSSTSSSFHTNALPPQAALPAARAQNRCLINHLIESWAAKLIFSITGIFIFIYFFLVPYKCSASSSSFAYGKGTESLPNQPSDRVLGGEINILHTTFGSWFSIRICSYWNLGTILCASG